MVKSHTHGMEHHHITDIVHTHEVTDPGHNHEIGKGDGRIQYNAYQGSSFWGSDPYFVTGGGQPYEGIYIVNHGTGISINNVDNNQRYKYSGGSVSDAQGTQRTSTDSNNANNNENRPKNYTVKIWKRTA